MYIRFILEESIIQHIGYSKEIKFFEKIVNIAGSTVDIVTVSNT